MRRACSPSASPASCPSLSPSLGRLTDYIGGDNYEEACHALAERKRLAGVGRVAEAAQLEMWVTQGHL